MIDLSFYIIGAYFLTFLTLISLAVSNWKQGRILQKMKKIKELD